MSEDNVPVAAPAAKNAFLSKGVIGGVLASMSGVLILFGVGLTPDDAKNVGDAVDMIVEKAFAISAAVGGILAVIGRIKAETKLKFPWQKD